MVVSFCNRQEVTVVSPPSWLPRGEHVCINSTLHTSVFVSISVSLLVSRGVHDEIPLSSSGRGSTGEGMSSEPCSLTVCSLLGLSEGCCTGAIVTVGIWMVFELNKNRIPVCCSSINFSFQNSWLE